MSDFSPVRARGPPTTPSPGPAVRFRTQSLPRPPNLRRAALLRREPGMTPDTKG
jgi:hypothetical protein